MLYSPIMWLDSLTIAALGRYGVSSKVRYGRTFTRELGCLPLRRIRPALMAVWSLTIGAGARISISYRCLR